MSGAIGIQPVDLYLTYAANETTRAAAALKANPQASALASYFQTAAPSITSPDALLKDYKSLSVVLGAFGLQGSINDTAILRQLLTQDPTSSTSLAQKLGNTKYQLFANALSNWQTPPFATPSAVSQIISSYSTNIFEQSADQQAPGLANALSFTREASSLTSVAAVQSDPNLLAVVVTSLGLPLQNFEELGFDQQTSLLTSKLTVSDLQNPTYVKHAAEQYLVQQQSTEDTTPAAGSLASLFSDNTDDDGDTLLSILNPDSSSSTDGSGSNANVLSLFA